MPGTPDPVIGGTKTTWSVAAVVAGVLACVPVVASGVEPTALGVGYGIGYTVVCLGIWAGTRVVAGAVPADSLAGVFRNRYGVQAFVLMFAQGALPAFTYVRWNLVGPILGVFVATTVLLALFLMVGGESDPLFLYGALFGVLVVGALCLLAALEFALTRWWGMF